MSSSKAITRELFKIRVGNRIAQVDLAEAAGYSPSTLSKLELGKRTPNIQLVCDWANALGYELVLRPKS